MIDSGQRRWDKEMRRDTQVEWIREDLSLSHMPSRAGGAGGCRFRSETGKMPKYHPEKQSPTPPLRPFLGLWCTRQDDPARAKSEKKRCCPLGVMIIFCLSSLVSCARTPSKFPLSPSACVCVKVKAKKKVACMCTFQ